MLPERVEAFTARNKGLQKENESLSAKLANLEASSILDQVEDIDGIPVLAQNVNVKDMNQLVIWWMI